MSLGISKAFKRPVPRQWLLIPTISVMDRYLALELFGPFFFGVGAFTSVGVAIGSLFFLVRKITESGLPIAIATKVFFLQLPYFVAFSLPTAMLLATLIAYSRLSSDSEIVALRSCGISIYRLILPAFMVSLVVTGATFVLNESIVPAAQYEARLTLDRALNEDTKDFQENNIIVPEFREVKQANGEKISVLSRLFYAQQFDGKTMKGLTILDRSQAGLNQIVIAESAEWNQSEHTWDFFNGTIYIVAPDGSYRNIMRFEHQELQIPRTPLDLASKNRDYAEMNIAQAQAQLELLRVSGDEKKIRKLMIRINQKYAIPFASVAFGIVGAALGTRPQRTTKATGFGISVLVIFGYYLLMSVGDALGLSNVLPPWMSGWLPTLSGFAMGMVLLVRASR